MKDIIGNFNQDALLVHAFTEKKDHRAFEKLYLKYGKKVEVYCLSAGILKQNCEDLVQNIFLKAFQKLDSLQNPNLWVAWLFTITRNEVLQFHKWKNSLKSSPIELYADLLYENSDFEFIMEREHKLEMIPRLLDEIPSGHLLKLKYLDGMSLVEIQTNQKINASALKMRMLRARSRVYQIYTKQHAV